MATSPLGAPPGYFVDFSLPNKSMLTSPLSRKRRLSASAATASYDHHNNSHGIDEKEMLETELVPAGRGILGNISIRVRREGQVVEELVSSKDGEEAMLFPGTGAERRAFHHALWVEKIREPYLSSLSQLTNALSSAKTARTAQNEDTIVTMLPDSIDYESIRKHFTTILNAAKALRERVMENEVCGVKLNTQLKGDVFTTICVQCAQDVQTSLDMYLGLTLVGDNTRNLSSILLYNDAEIMFSNAFCETCGLNKAAENLKRTEVKVSECGESVFNWFRIARRVQKDCDTLVSFAQRAHVLTNSIATTQEPKQSQATSASLIAQMSLCLAEFRRYSYVLAMCVCSRVSAIDDNNEQQDEKEAKPTSTLNWLHKNQKMNKRWKELVSCAENTQTRYCRDQACVVCELASEDAWGELPVNMGRADVYDRLHPWVDETGLWWLNRLLVTAAYLDSFGKRDAEGLKNGLASLKLALMSELTMLNGTVYECVAKIRGLLNLNTYMLRRQLRESVVVEGSLGSRMCVNVVCDLRSAIACRVYEGMTLPYVEIFAATDCCTKCMPWVRLAGASGIIIHDALDFINDILSGETMNVYRMVASLGREKLLAYARGCDAIMCFLSGDEVLKHVCCQNQLKSALAGSVGWYYCCDRYNVPANIRRVYGHTQDNGWNIEDVKCALDLYQVDVEVATVMLAEIMMIKRNNSGYWNCQQQKWATKQAEVTYKEFKYLPLTASVCYENAYVSDADLDEETLQALVKLAGRNIHVPNTTEECLSCEYGSECVMIGCNTMIASRHVEYALLNQHAICSSELDL